MDLKLKQEASIKGSKRLVITICLLILAFFFVLHLWKVYRRVNRPEKVALGIARLSKIYRIYEIKTDRFEDRFVWAATDAGLAQYNKDNGALRLFGFQDSIPSEIVSSVLPLENAIWAGHWWGLSRLDRKDYKVTNLTQKEGLASKRIFTMAADKGLIYAGGDEGITVLDNAFTVKGKITKGSGLIGREVYSLKVYQDRLYAGHEAGRLSIYHLKDKKVKGIRSDRADKKTVIGDILKDGNSLWIATSNAGVWSYHLKTGQITYHVPTTGFPAKGAYAVEKIDGDIWCGTSFGIARKFGNTSSWILLRDERQANEGLFQIMALTGDAGYVWYGAADVGIGKYFKEKIEWLPLSGSMTHDHIQAIGVVGNQVYLGFGYLGDCVDVIDRETLAFMKNMKPWEGISLQLLTRIHADLDYIYFCGFSGLSLTTRQTTTWTNLGNPPRGDRYCTISGRRPLFRNIPRLKKVFTPKQHPP
jgi:ligand-binding sensor domain-containing protein